MKQTSFFKSQSKEHGGVINLGKRKKRRPLSTKEALHVTLRATKAKGARSLLKYRALINRVLSKATRLNDVKIYQKAVCGNHIHLLIKGKNRSDIQNFFRVVAGHIAQGILFENPLTSEEVKALQEKAGGAPIESPKFKKYVRKFWDYIIYSRVTSWGRDFKTVKKYIQQNLFEALNLIAYTPRKRKTPRKSKAPLISKTLCKSKTQRRSDTLKNNANKVPDG